MIVSADRFGQYVVTRQKELNHKGSYETNFGGGEEEGVDVALSCTRSRGAGGRGVLGFTAHSKALRQVVS